MATGAKWIPPLPHGYEARWDPNQRAYFFINHADKTTTWQDPRFPPAVGSQHVAAAQHLNSHADKTGTAGHQDVAMTTMYKQFGSTTATGDYSEDEDWESDSDIPFGSEEPKKVDLQKVHQLRQLFPSAPEEIIRNVLMRNDNVLGLTTGQLTSMGYKKEEHTAHPAPKVVDMVERLRAMYPAANPGLVQDVLQQCRNDEKSARAQLESIGYRPQFPATQNSGSRKHSPSPSPKKPVSPARKATPTLTEGQKSQLERQFKMAYKDLEASVVEMALQVCDYDEERTRNLLDRMKEDNAKGGSGTGGASRPSTSASQSASRTSRSPSPPPSSSQFSLEPAPMLDDVRNRPSTSNSKAPASRPGTSSKSGTNSSRQAAPRSTSPAKSKTRAVSPTKKTSPPKTQQQRAKNVTQLSEDVLNSTMDMLNHLTTNVACCRRSETDDAVQPSGSRVKTQGVISTQPHGYEYDRTLAKGPDPSLRAGPNKDILLTDYMSAHGPNPDIRQGPDPGRVSGSQGACGPDRANYCGPQIHHLDSHQPTPLVTAI